MRRGLLGCVGSKIENVIKPRSRYRPLPLTPPWKQFRRDVCGQQVIAIRRIAKRVLVDLEDQNSIVFQPKMAGLLVTADPPTVAHIRFVFELVSREDAPEKFIYWDRRGLGTVHLWDREQQNAFLGPDKLGKDALEISRKEFQDVFGKSKRAIKVALLDQKLVAGVGNLYASEILHRCRIHPEIRSNELTLRQLGKIWTEMRGTLQTAILYEGSTLSDGTYVNSVSDPGRYQNEHQAYARDGHACFHCKTGIIERIVQAQRSTFFCPQCQKMAS